MPRPPSQLEIETGYWLTNWRRANQTVADSFGDMVMGFYRQAEDALIEEGSLPGGMVASEGKIWLQDACKAPHHVGIAHNIGRGILKKAGVREIKAADFQQFEAEVDFQKVFGADAIGWDTEGYYLKVRLGGGGGR